MCVCDTSSCKRGSPFWGHKVVKYVTEEKNSEIIVTRTLGLSLNPIPPISLCQLQTLQIIQVFLISQSHNDDTYVGLYGTPTNGDLSIRFSIIPFFTQTKISYRYGVGLPVVSVTFPIHTTKRIP